MRPETTHIGEVTILTKRRVFYIYSSITALAMRKFCKDFFIPLVLAQHRFSIVIIDPKVYKIFELFPIVIQILLIFMIYN